MKTIESPSKYDVADIAAIMTKAGRLQGGDPESVRFALRTSGVGSVTDLVKVLDDAQAVVRLKAAADSMHRHASTTAHMTTEQFADTLRALLMRVGGML